MILTNFTMLLMLNVKYDLNNLVGDTSQWFDPYVYLGGGYTLLEILVKEC